jgi:hypothetical protein
MKSATLFVTVLLLGSPALGAEYYVSMNTGDNSGAGSREAPFQNLATALEKAGAGDVVHVAKGNYFGLRGKGYLEVKAPVTIIGGYADDFSRRDVAAFPTLIQPDNASAAKSSNALMTLKQSAPGQKFVVDGLVFDMGMRSSYARAEGKPEGVQTGMLLLAPDKADGDNPTIAKQCLTIENPAAAGDVLVQNCVFVNCVNFAIQGAHKQGDFIIRNNVFVANRMAAIEVFGTGGKKGPKGPTEKDGHVEISNNTILLTWSRLKDFQDMGYGARIMTNLSYDIRGNIFGLNVITGIDNTRFNPLEWARIDNNLFFGNKQGDLLLSESGNIQMERVMAKDLSTIRFASVKGNKGTTARLPVDKAYLEGFMGARYSEEADYHADSSANLMREALGMNKQGKLTTSVTMFANRYPWKEALRLFGATAEAGAQALPKN